MDGYLGGLPDRRTAKNPLTRAGLGGGHSEVGKDEIRVLRVAVRPQEDIGGLDIAVYNRSKIPWWTSTIISEVVVSSVDVGQSVGDLLVRVPDERFGNLDAMITVGVNEVLKVTIGAEFVPKRCKGRSISVCLQVDDVSVSVKNVHKYGSFKGFRLFGVASATFHDLADEVIAVTGVLVKIAVTLATNTDGFNELVGLVLDLAECRMIYLQIYECPFSDCRAEQVDAGGKLGAFQRPHLNC